MRISWPIPGFDDWQNWAQKLVNLLPTSFAQDFQTGAVMSFRGTTTPDGWLKCDGSTFNAASFPELKLLLGGTTLPTYTSPFASCVVGIKV